MIPFSQDSGLTSIQLAQSFLDNFNYCNKETNKRDASTFDKIKDTIRIFSSHSERGKLEKLANTTTTAMKAILDLSKDDNQERVNDIIGELNKTIEKFWEIRIDNGTTESSGGGYNSSGTATYGGSDTSPQAPSKFEKELDKTLKSMRRLAKQILLNPASGEIGNLDDYRLAINTLKIERLALEANATRRYSTTWAD